MTAAESVALAGKMWLYEDDARTYLSAENSGYDRVDDPGRDERRELLRNTGQCAAAQFRHVVDGSGGGRLVRRSATVGRDDATRRLDEPLLAQPRPFRPEVAAVIDPQSMMRVAAGGAAVTLPGVYQVRRPLGRMGTPYGQYLQDDVIAGKVQAKMYVFLTAWCLAPDERERLLAATRGSTRVWCYAPGYQEPDGHVARRDARADRIPTREGHARQGAGQPTAVGQKLGLQQSFGVDAPINPLFAAVGRHGGRDAGDLSGRIRGDRPAAHGRRAVAVRRRAGTHLRTAAAGGARAACTCSRSKTATCTPTVRMWCCTPRRMARSKSTPVRRVRFATCWRTRSSATAQDHVAAQEG